MIDFKEAYSGKRHSLYLGLIGAIALGVLFALLTYVGVRATSNYFINRFYITEEGKNSREIAYLESLQRFCDTRELSSADTDEIKKWARDNRYVYLLVYKDDQLFFESEIDDGNNVDGDYSFIGDIVSHPDLEALLAAAEENGLHELKVSDGLLFASVAEFTELLYYDLANIGSLIVAVLVLALLLIFYVSRIIARIKKLENDVAIVASGDMTHIISSDGRDEIAILSSNVENMRISIIDKLRIEREAIDANNELITSMSHDIRTPLTVLLGYLDMMKDYDGTDEVLRGYVAASENTAMRLKHLSDDMFKYSLAFGGSEGGVKLEEYDAKTLLEQLFAEHILLLNESGYNTSFELDDSLRDGEYYVCTDAPNLMRIVDNLFSNLTKYADRDYPVVLTVKLNGMTLIIECTNRISKNSDAAESNGIGLKTCKRLASVVADGFDYSDDGEYFVTKLSLKLNRK